MRLWAEHLEASEAEVATRAPHEVVDERWRPTAFEQRGRRERGEPLTHRLCALPHISRRSRRLLGPLDSFLVDG